MSLKGRVYSVLIVSAAENINSALFPMLQAPCYGPVKTAASVAEAARAVSERGYDLVIINSPLPDDAGMDLACRLCADSGSSVLLLVKAAAYEATFERAAGYGVFVLAKPFPRQMMVAALDWMASARERMKKGEKQTISIQEKMDEIKAVNRAKWLLISELKLDEQGAHRYIEKQAMDRCITRRQIAEEIIRIYG